MKIKFEVKVILGALVIFILMSFQSRSFFNELILNTKGHPKFLKLYKGKTFVFEKVFPANKVKSPFLKYGQEFLITPSGFLFGSGQLLAYKIDSVYKVSPKKLMKSGLIKGEEPDPLYPQEQIIVYRFPELNTSILAFDEEFGELYQGKYYQWVLGEYVEHEPKLGYTVILMSSTDVKMLDNEAKSIAAKFGGDYSPAIFKKGEFFNFKLEESIVTDNVTYHYIKRTSDDFGRGISLEKKNDGKVELLVGVFEQRKAAEKRLNQLIKEYPNAKIALSLFDNDI